MKKSLRQSTAELQRRINSDLIDEMAVQALVFLADDPDRLGRFFDITGLTVQTLRQVAGTSRFNASLLDYLGSDEALLRAFADHSGYDPAQVDTARMSMSDPRVDRHD